MYVYVTGFVLKHKLTTFLLKDKAAKMHEILQIYVCIMYMLQCKDQGQSQRSGQSGFGLTTFC